MALPFFAITLFVSAFLLFLVQPMIGKLVLPRLGGAPQVWNTCMVFFQSALLAGYAYTHTVSTRLTLRRQLLIHGVLLLAPFIVLFPNGPFDISSFEPPRGANPISYTLLFLTLIVGLPFFVVSTSAPLLQKWFSGTGHPASKDPYFLYGASNLGSMLALLAYPLLVEPIFTLEVQTWTWAIGYVVLVGFILGCAAMVWKAPPAVPLAGTPSGETPLAEIPAAKPGQTSTAIQPAHKTRRKKGPAEITKDFPSLTPTAAPPGIDDLTAGRRLRWVLWAAAPSSMMLGVTTYMSTDLSPIPLFWVLPLALYLLSFILVFLRYPIPWTTMPHNVMKPIQAFVICVLCLFIVLGSRSPTWATSITLVSFFFAAMVCHGELARDRPSTRHLTEFFLWMSVGGMLGGVFNGLVAPLIFLGGVAEYPLAIVAVCLLRPQEQKEGWVDGTLSDSFPGLVPWLGERGKDLASMGWPAFAILVVGVGGGWSLLVFGLDQSADFPPFLVQVLYFLGILAALALVWLRFRSGQAFNLITDLVLGLFVLCLAYFLSHNAVSNWGWRKTDLDVNPLARFFDSLGFPKSWAMNIETSQPHPGIGYVFLVFGIPLIFALCFLHRPWRFGLAVGGMLLANLYWSGRNPDLLKADRSYFGVLRVNQEFEYISVRQMIELLQVKDISKSEEIMKLPRVKDDEGNIFFKTRYTYLMHGTTHHGLNYQEPKGLARLATTYYHRKGPTGIIMERLNWFPGPQNTFWADNRMPASLVGLGASPMGVTPLPTAQLVAAWSEPPYATIGLGTGTMASYGRPFQHVVFYEIDAKIRNFHLPPDQPYYTYLDLPKFREFKPYYNFLHNAIERGCNVEVIMGDARRSMEKEDQSPGGMNPRRDNYYRVIEVDAFSSDAIPVHLITEEAIKLYFDKLHEEGVVCVHTSNRHVDLVQPVTDIATKLGIKYRVGKDGGGSGYRGHFSSEYVMLARQEKYLPAEGQVKSPLTDKTYMEWYTPPAPGNPIWTNDYSNLVGILRERFAFTWLLVLLGGIGVLVAALLWIGKAMAKT